MAFKKSMQVKSTGHSKCLWMDRAWGIEKGDMLTIEADICGKTYYHTTAAKLNCSKFVTLPAFWPVEVGDIIDVKITYANVPMKEAPETPNPKKRAKTDDDPGAEDQA